MANCSTAAQYFHLLRKQALTDKQRPLVIFTPKSLLRAKPASSTLDELANDWFHAVLDDPTVTGNTGITTMILCSGKIYHELQASPLRAARTDLAIGRVECSTRSRRTSCASCWPATRSWSASSGSRRNR